MLIRPLDTGIKVPKPVRVVRRKNVYFGDNSVLRLTLPSGNPQKVDTPEDLLALIYAWAIDFITGNGVLTHYESVDGKYVVLAPPTRYLLNGRAKVLHRLVSKIRLMGGDPRAWHAFISRLSYLIGTKQKAQAWAALTEFAQQTGTVKLLNAIKQRIEESKARPKIDISQVAR